MSGILRTVYSSHKQKLMKANASHMAHLSIILLPGCQKNMERVFELLQRVYRKQFSNPATLSANPHIETRRESLSTSLPALEFGGSNWRARMPWRTMLTRPISADTMEMACFLWGWSSRVLPGRLEVWTGSTDWGREKKKKEMHRGTIFINTWMNTWTGFVQPQLSPP